MTDPRTAMTTLRLLAATEDKCAPQPIRLAAHPTHDFAKPRNLTLTLTLATPSAPSLSAQSAPAPSVPDSNASNHASIAGRILELINAERAAAGCGPVHQDERLDRAATGHSADMARNGISITTPHKV